MKRDVYLTIDLDYWYDAKRTGSGLDFIKQVFDLKRPTTLYTEHHLILKEISKQYSKICNVDFHADIGDRTMYWPNCGSWAHYVHGRRNAEYEWRYPSYELCVAYGWGLCHYGFKEDSKYNPFTHSDMWTWKNISRTQGFDGIEMDRVDKVSLILSHRWSRPKVIHDTLAFISDSDKVKFYSKSAAHMLDRMLADDPTLKYIGHV